MAKKKPLAESGGGKALYGGCINVLMGDTGFLCPNGEMTAVMATEAYEQVVAPFAGTIKNLYVNLDTAPGTSRYRDFYVRKNGVNTAVAVSLTGTQKTGNSGTAMATVAAGDLLAIYYEKSGGVANTRARYGFEIDPL